MVCDIVVAGAWRQKSIMLRLSAFRNLNLSACCRDHKLEAKETRGRTKKKVSVSEGVRHSRTESREIIWGDCELDWVWIGITYSSCGRIKAI